MPSLYRLCISSSSKLQRLFLLRLFYLNYCQGSEEVKVSRNSRQTQRLKRMPEKVNSLCSRNVMFVSSTPSVISLKGQIYVATPLCPAAQQ